MKTGDYSVTEDMLSRYFELNKLRKEIDSEMKELKEVFHSYMDHRVGENKKGEYSEGSYQLVRQIRKAEKYRETETVEKLEEMQLHDLILVQKKPDVTKINAAAELGLLRTDELEELKTTSYTQAIAVKKV
ncbi:hypothetical protein [Oceanobacillus iheyensis HTE831]|uniref:Uncharacterized protein n=1 Tax=Oceanobacillus iheyensis (strain DSM 14371 / CIP 107618 / JCM 11309 / KCTC 3954 / HTE831) TaxID=221109 RepID=Q8EME4_OCEIH|nr:hypothetical protein [Oceanobacillus iheyensis]BAC14861.1 hypothetical protein [Oceanobacillus iheyensis HTE831]